MTEVVRPWTRAELERSGYWQNAEGYWWRWDGRQWIPAGADPMTAASGSNSPAPAGPVPTVRLRIEPEDWTSGELHGYGVSLYDGNRVLVTDSDELVRPGVAYFRVAGIGHHGNAASSPAVRPGATMQLVRESDNPVDGNAIAVVCDAGKVGYVPRNLAAVIAGGEVASSGIVARVFDATGGRRVVVELLTTVGAELLLDTKPSCC